MNDRPDDTTLDHLLTTQLLIAWAGEGRCDPPRLGWWQTDLVDDAGGGDFFRRLCPRTHLWASLEAVREAARRVDAQARKAAADPDRLLTPFHFGYDIDEAIDERLTFWRRQADAPIEVLPRLAALQAPFTRDALTLELSRAPAPWQVAPGGRLVKGPPPADLARAADALAAALVPFTERYPLPFYRLEG